MKNIFQVSILFICLSCFSQNDISHNEQKMFDEASIVKSTSMILLLEGGFENKNPEVAEFARKVQKRILENTLEIYQDMIDSFPKTKLLNRIRYEIAEIFRELGDLQSAKSYYIQVLQNPQSLNFSCDNTESYYRNDICLILAKMFIDKNEYITALKFLDESKKYDDILKSSSPMMDSLPTFDKLYKIVKSETKSKE